MHYGSWPCGVASEMFIDLKFVKLHNSHCQPTVLRGRYSCMCIFDSGCSPCNMQHVYDSRLHPISVTAQVADSCTTHRLRLAVFWCSIAIPMHASCLCYWQPCVWRLHNEYGYSTQGGLVVYKYSIMNSLLPHQCVTVRHSKTQQNVLLPQASGA